jgi:hypothetical protein
MTIVTRPKSMMKAENTTEETNPEIPGCQVL